MNRAAISLGAMVTLAAHTQPSPSVGRPLPPMPVPQDNPQSAEKIALGRHLFFDGRLSADGKISCASCHDPRQAWAGHDAAIGESKRFFERWRTLPDRSIATSIAGAERSVAAFATV